jgi:4-hydroxy-tetrahydrodipicolinate synthase
MSVVYEFSGTLTALVTPLRAGRVDVAALDALVDSQIAAGVDGLVAVGTTGESATLSTEEQREVIAAVVARAAGRVPVVAGCGSASTATTLALLAGAQEAGAQGALVVTPYYNRPGQAGLLAHFRAVAAGTDLPVILYNVPTRTGTDMNPETVAELATLPNVVGLKDATGDMSRVSRHRALCGAAFTLLSGDDPSALGFVAHGGDGVVSVTSNVVPGPMARMIRAARAGDFEPARALNASLADLHKALFVEPSPAPAKWALSQAGIGTPEVRLPLVPLSPAAEPVLRAALHAAGLEV